MTRSFLSGAAITALLAFGAGCAKKEPPAHRYPLRGYVVEIDPKAAVASIHAEKIDGFMGEMTMEYPIADRAEYQALRKGEKITATVNVTEEKYWLTDVKERKVD